MLAGKMAGREAEMAIEKEKEPVAAARRRAAPRACSSRATATTLP
jgi:hypothetical protein